MSLMQFTFYATCIRLFLVPTYIYSFNIFCKQPLDVIWLTFHSFCAKVNTTQPYSKSVIPTSTAIACVVKSRACALVIAATLVHMVQGKHPICCTDKINIVLLILPS